MSLSYSGSTFHRVIPGKCVQGGDFTRGDGRGGRSVFGSTFKDESFRYAHERGSLSMANSGANTNGSQFFVCLKRMSNWDGRHVVFGRVIRGLKVCVCVYVCMCVCVYVCTRGRESDDVCVCV